MADTGATAKPARGRGRATGDATEPTEPTDPTEPAGDATEPDGDIAEPTPAGSGSRRRWSVPMLFFLLVLLAAIAGWAFGIVSYLDKEDVDDQLDDLQQSDAESSTEFEDRIAELDARLEELESERRATSEDRQADVEELRTRIDDCVEETQVLIDLFQDALGGDDVGEDALDTQAGRTQRVCADVADSLGSDSDDSASTPSTTTLPP